MSAYLPHTARLRTGLCLADLLGLGAAIWFAFQVRFEILPRVGVFTSANVREEWEKFFLHPGLLIWMLVAGLLLNMAAELYEPEVLHRRREVAIRVLVAVTAWAVVIVVTIYFLQKDVGRGLLGFFVALWAPELILSRWLFTAWRRRRTRFPALVMGDREAVGRFCAELARRPSAPWSPIDGSEVEIGSLQGAIEEHGAAIVVLTGSNEQALEMEHDLVALHFSGVPVVASSEVWAWLEERLPIEALTPSLFLHQPGFGAVHWSLFNRLTRLIDVFLASLLLVLATVPLLLAALVIVLADGWPVLYRQRRVGQFGRLFTMNKLRTMTRDAERGGPSFAQHLDPRTIRLLGIPVGRWLRRFRLDELPQLINVLRGEMSLVGPRPERPEFVEALAEEIPYYAFRTAVPPGISGWAQVNTPYAHNDLDDHRRKLEFDLYFIRERSLRLYLLTLVRTVSAALVGAREPEKVEKRMEKKVTRVSEGTRDTYAAATLRSSASNPDATTSSA